MEVLERDAHRCRWCGATNRPIDLHHVRYRRNKVDDVAWNLISLDREHHSFVHGLKPNGRGEFITKRVAQLVLWELAAQPGITGISLWRSWRAQWLREGKCIHGAETGTCLDCSDRESSA